MLVIGLDVANPAAALRRRECRVWALVRDRESAQAAKEHCEAVILTDAERLELADLPPNLAFDAILLLDVLSRLGDPRPLLDRCRRALAPDGRLIALVPNVTHAAVRLEILSGRFRIRETVPLQSMHLRFFHDSGLDVMFRSAGYTIEEKLPLTRGITESGLELDLTAVADDVLDLATSDPNGSIYEFLVLASPRVDENEGAHGATLLERLQHERNELERQLVEARAVFQSRLKEARTGFRGQLERQHSELRGQVEERLAEEARLRDEARERFEGELAQKDEECERLEAELAEKSEELTQLHEELTQLRSALQATRYRVADAAVTPLRAIPLVHEPLRRVARRLFPAKP